MTGTALVKEMARHGRRYVDCLTRKTWMGLDVGGRRECEHCDGERSPLVREDSLRGNVCPPCDSSLDEMFDEYTYEQKAVSP